ncbi:catalase, partial [Qipengyuania citrea]|nr:catalase [Qipengyuania citrea]
FFRANGTEYELRAQLCTDLETMPVEDAAVLWEEEKSPHRAIATLRFDSQDPYSPPRQVFGDDVLSFNPWNGVEAHRPLGGIMRIRRAAYERSSAYRHTQNDRPRIEPQALSDLPD